MVVYADILFVINFFITYLLLLLTSLLLKSSSDTLRFLLSSAIGGVYSLTIFVDKLNFFISIAGKLLVSLLMVFVAFGFVRLEVFIKNVIVFYFSNMLLLGFVMMVIFVAKPKGISINNSVIYFDVTVRGLLISALLAYLAACLVFRIYNRQTAKNEIYSITVEKGKKSYHLYALVDSGNKLREPFSDYPVIIVDESKIPCEAERIIPFNTVGGEGMLRAFRPDRLIISNAGKQCETDKVYIAASTVDSKDFSAIINPELLNI